MSARTASFKEATSTVPRDSRPMTTASAIVPSGLWHAMPSRRDAEVLVCSLAVVARSVLISASPGGAPDLRGKRCRAPTGDRLGGLARVFVAAHESVTSHEANDMKCRIRPWVSRGSRADTVFHPCDGIL